MYSIPLSRIFTNIFAGLNYPMADFEAQRDDNIAANAPIGGLSSKQQEIDTVTAAITPLLAAGFPQAIFNYDDLLLRGYTAKTFCDFIKPLSAITERRELISLCALGNNRFWDMSVVAELDEFLNFVKWLKSPEGRDAQTQAAKKRALNKKASDGMSTKDVALVQMGNAIIADYQRERKQRRFPIEEEMAELRRQLRQLDEELQAVEEEIKVKYGPVALYEGPDNTRVKSDAYLMYQDNCRKKGYRAIAQYQGGFEKAVELFGNKVREAHFCAYLSDPARSDFVRDYYNQKIVHLERSGEKKQAGSFRSLLVAAHGEVAVNVPIINPFNFDGEDSGRESSQTGGNANQPPASKKRRQKSRAEREAERLQIDQPVRTQARTSRVLNKSRNAGGQDQDLQIVGVGAGEDDPHVQEQV